MSSACDIWSYMEFRPCIDIHNGKVKQIVGSSLRDEGDSASENFVSKSDASWYASLYKDKGLSRGHVILLNHKDSEYYESTKAQAISAIKGYPMGLQVGGGITPDSACEFLEAGASHVIVTSYVFSDGRINMDNLERMVRAVGKEKLVLDLSCKKTDRGYVVVTDRWQRLTDQVLDERLLMGLSDYCDEFLIHAVDVEGKANGIETELVSMISGFDKRSVTYAGGIGSYECLYELKNAGNGRINATIGSALDIFGGNLSIDKIIDICRE